MEILATRQAEDVRVRELIDDGKFYHEVALRDPDGGYTGERFQTENGLIRDSGKFEHNPYWIPYFWQMVGEGYADEDYESDAGVTVYVFELRDEHGALDEGWAYLLDLFPEIGDAKIIEIWETEVGFVNYGSWNDLQAYAQMREQQELEDEELSDEDAEDALDDAEKRPEYPEPLEAVFSRDTCLYDVGGECGPAYLYLDNKRHDYHQGWSGSVCARCGDSSADAFTGETGEICPECANEMVWNTLAANADYNVDTDNGEFTLDWRTLYTEELKAVYFDKGDVTAEEAEGNPLFYTWFGHRSAEYLQRGFYVGGMRDKDGQVSILTVMGYVIFGDDAKDLPDTVHLHTTDEPEPELDEPTPTH